MRSRQLVALLALLVSTAAVAHFHRGAAQPGGPAPPGNAADTVAINDTSGSTQTNEPISIGRPFAQGEIAQFAQAWIGSTPLTTQCDVKNRWPDGSLKFAIVSFLVPTITGNGSVTVSFKNNPTGNNTGFLTESGMIASGYNFDGQIQLTGTASHNISARTMLTTAGTCSDPGSDPDGGAFECTYWLKGPIVTAVILEDRSGRSFDVNTDAGTGNPLHPIFEAWFYPQNNAVLLGYTLEDDWASSTAANSARDQTYSVKLTAGNTSPATVFTNGSFTQTTRTRWHRSFCANGTGNGNAYVCGPGAAINYNWPYLATTKFTPNWDPALTISAGQINGIASPASFAATNQTLAPQATLNNALNGAGFFPNNAQGGFAATGGAPWHGPLTTWDIYTLISEVPAMFPVTYGNADLGGGITYFYREADTNAGHGQTFDNSGIPGNVQTEGRVVSINARTQVNLMDVTAQSCNTNYAADWINFGGSGQDFGVWGDFSTSHWPNLAYAAYLLSGQYAYYEEQLMQSAYALGAPGNAPGSSRACTQPTANQSLRMGSAGYWWVDQERGTDWAARDTMLGAFIAVDGSPEQAYFTDKLKANIAVWEGIHGVTNDTGAAYATAWSYGNTSRNTSITTGTQLGSWTHGSPGPGVGGYAGNYPICYQTTGAGGAGNCPTSVSSSVASDANSNFQNDYSVTIIGWMCDLGFCTGNGALLSYVSNFLINSVENPAANMYNLGVYVYPTQDASGGEITSWTEQESLYYQQAGSWATNHCSDAGSFDEDYPSESISALSYLTNITSSQGGYSGLAAYNQARSTYPCATNTNYATLTPKWDMVPRTTSSTDFLSPAAGWHKIRGSALCGGGSESNNPFTDPDTFPHNLNSAYTSYGYGFSDSNNCTQMMEDSSSGFYDTVRHRLVLFGGGHEHYFGNDLVSVEMSPSTGPAMVHLDHPADPETCPNTGTANTTVTESNGAICHFNSSGAVDYFGNPGCSYAVGCTPSQHTTAVAVHTYNSEVYIPGYDEFAVFGGVTGPNGDGTPYVWTLSMASVPASCAPNLTTNQQGCDPNWTLANSTQYNNDGNAGQIADYDPNTQGVFIRTQSDFQWFNPANNSVTEVSGIVLGYHSSGLVDPVDKYFISIGPSGTGIDGIQYVNIACTGSPSTPSNCPGVGTSIKPSTPSCATLLAGLVQADGSGQAQYYGVAWDPIGKRVAIYPNGTNAIYYLNPHTWACTSETYGSTQGTDYPQNVVFSAGTAGDQGTFGHFRYDPTFDVFVLCNDPNNDCWYLRPNR